MENFVDKRVRAGFIKTVSCLKERNFPFLINLSFAKIVLFLSSHDDAMQSKLTSLEGHRI